MHHSYLDQYAYRTSWVHSLDPRAKVFVLALFTTAVVTVPPPQILPLLPFWLYPLWLGILSRTPWKFLLRHLLANLFFLLPILLLELVYAPTWQGALLACAHVSLKFGLTVLAILLTVATTPFAQILRALEWFRLPRLFLLQIHFLYRYLFLTVEETQRMLRARQARSAGVALSARELTRSGASMIGQLFLRSTYRSKRIFDAMRARGFDGNVRLAAPLCWHWRDTVFCLVGSCGVLLFWWGALM